MKIKRRYRTIVVRNGRRYVLCGPRAIKPEERPASASGLWLPGATFLLVLCFSVYIIGRPPVYPFATTVAAPRFTFDDFVNATR